MFLVTLLLVVAAPTPKPIGLGQPVEVKPAAPMHVHGAFLSADNATLIVVGGPPWVDTDDGREQKPADEPRGYRADLLTGKPTAFADGPGTILHADGTADGEHVVTSHRNDGLLYKIRDAAGKPLRTFRPPPERDSDLWADFRCTPSGRILLSTQEALIRVNLADGAEVDRFTHPSFAGGNGDAPHEAPAIGPGERRVATVTQHNRVMVWDVKTKATICDVSVLPPAEELGQCRARVVVFLSENVLLASRSGSEAEVKKGTTEADTPAVRRGVVRIDVPAKTVTPLRVGQSYHTLHLAAHPAGEWVATVGPSYRDRPDPKYPANDTVGEIRVFHLPAERLAARVQFDDGFYPAWVGFTPDGRRLVAVDCGTGTARVWEFAAERLGK